MGGVWSNVVVVEGRVLEVPAEADFRMGGLGIGELTSGVGVRMNGELGSSGMSGSLGGTEGDRLVKKKQDTVFVFLWFTRKEVQLEI